ncbi:hypothetical protein [Virgibacillus dokdonensis]|nr:hypothetical protein [Virgibacillus dokdonensis]
MKIYNTTKNLSIDIEQGQQLLNYIDKPLVEKQISVDADDKDVVIKL